MTMLLIFLFKGLLNQPMLMLNTMGDVEEMAKKNDDVADDEHVKHINVRVDTIRLFNLLI